MKPDYLGLRSTKAILEFILRNDGEVNWYRVAINVDRLGLEKHPPTYGVLKELVASGYLHLDPPEGGIEATYSLTNAGRDLLKQLLEDDNTEE